MKLTVVIPCYNEANIIDKMYEKLTSLFQSDEFLKSSDYQIVFVDDGSKDNTLDVFKKLNANDTHVKYISFSRNFGKEAAMMAGLSYSDGDAVLLIDADLQHPPELIPEMVKYYFSGYDQVIAKRNRVGESKTKTFFSKAYYKFVNHLVEVELTDGVGDFRLLSRRAVDALLSMQEYNRFSKGLFSWIGFESKIIEYENQARVGGVSKWNFRRLIQYGIDGVLSFNNRPLRSTLYFGLTMVGLGMIYILYSLIRIFVKGIDMPGYFTIISSVLIMGGVQLISTGVIGEYIGRIYYEVKRRPHFIVKDTNIREWKLKHNLEEDYEK